MDFHRKTSKQHQKNYIENVLDLKVHLRYFLEMLYDKAVREPSTWLMISEAERAPTDCSR